MSASTFSNIFCQENLPSSKTIISTALSIAATAVFVRTLTDDLIPETVRDYFSSNLNKLSKRFSSQFTIVIEETDGLSPNHIYQAANTYLGRKITPSTQRIKLSKPIKEDTVSITIDKNEEILDVFDGVGLKWKLLSSRIENANSSHRGDRSSNLPSEMRSFELSFHKKYKDKVLKSYISHVLNEVKTIKEETKVLKLHMVDYRNGGDYWGSVNLDHPTTFETLAMESEVKSMLIEDLNEFVERKEFYKRVGKAWKRGYLLYGPPGTGKSSLVAAMANYLKFDIYDLDLTEVQCNSDLRRLLLGTANRSILVVEDVDCAIELEDRRKDKDPDNAYQNQVTLSGVLNFIDGLWSSCGDERIIVFTTNYKDRLDPAMLRPGRMDIHIHMSYCTVPMFHTLASNYLQGKHDHPLFRDIEELLDNVKVTPAEVAGELMKTNDVERSLKGLLKFLQDKKIQCHEQSSQSVEGQEEVQVN